MTEESALSRWSRLKRRSLEPPAVVEPELPIEIPPPAETIPLDEITAWLGRRVPEGWREAALRRVWSADIGIRDFIGPADYAWDWNTPGGAPGWGPIRAIDDMVRALSRAIGEDLPPPPEPEPPTQPSVGIAELEQPETAIPLVLEAAPEPSRPMPMPRRGGRAAPI